MGVLLRGPQERFNPQIHTEDNSLTTLMKKDFAVAKKTFDLFKKYNKFQSWMYYSGRVNQGIQKGKMFKASRELNDNAYRIHYEGMDILPAYSFGGAVFGALFDANNPTPNMTGNGVTNAGTINGGFTNVATNTLCSISVKHEPANGIFGDKFNPNDRITLNAGLGITIIFTREGRLSSTGDHYVYDGKTVGPAALFATSHLAADNVFTEAGSAFGEGSLKGYQRTARNKWKINYSFITRYSLTMTGSAKKQKIAWIYNSDKPGNQKEAWDFAEVLRGEKIFRMMNELALRNSRISMDPATHAWFENYGTNNLTVDGFKPESGIAAPKIGNGWIPEIEENATFDYNPNNGLSHKVIESLTNILATRSPEGNSGNTFIAVTDRIGRTAFDAGMKKLIQYDQAEGNGGLTNMVYDINAAQDVSLGFEVKKYYYLGNWFILIEDELLNHPGLYPTNGGLVGTGNIYVLNATPVDGVPNFEVLSRSGRAYKKKNVDGMHSFDSKADASNQAASGFDGCTCHMLSDLMAVVYDTRSCGILRSSAAWNGGALSASTIAGEKANVFTW